MELILFLCVLQYSYIVVLLEHFRKCGPHYVWGRTKTCLLTLMSTTTTTTTTTDAGELDLDFGPALFAMIIIIGVLLVIVCACRAHANNNPRGPGISTESVDVRTHNPQQESKTTETVVNRKSSVILVRGA